MSARFAFVLPWVRVSVVVFGVDGQVQGENAGQDQQIVLAGATSTA
jgi:hypothetical protein